VVDASYLIAADGSHSAIRKALGCVREVADAQLRACDLHIAGDVPEDQLSIFWPAMVFSRLPDG
jgi:2-polyprenyl-6-methoxyphenol hydroxylase-like FAD-dependent oxidoreductase